MTVGSYNSALSHLYVIAYNHYLFTFIVVIAVIVGSYNKYFITSMDFIAVIVGSYNQFSYFITSIYGCHSRDSW